MGAASEARQRKQRGLARHVAWLTSVFQTNSCHHTATSTTAPSCPGCAGLVARVSELERRLSRRPAVPHVSTPGRQCQRAEEASANDGAAVVLPVPWDCTEAPPHNPGKDGTTAADDTAKKEYEYDSHMTDINGDRLVEATSIEHKMIKQAIAAKQEGLEGNQNELNAGLTHCKEEQHLEAGTI